MAEADPRFPFALRQLALRLKGCVKRIRATLFADWPIPALAGRSRGELAKRSGTNLQTIKHFETASSDPKLSTLLKWRRALIAQGVEFLDPDPYSPGSGPGVRLRGVPPKGRR